MSNLQQLQQHNDALIKQITQLQSQCNQAQEKINWFEEQFRLLRHRQFGASAETAHSLNLPLFDSDAADEIKETIQTDNKKETITYTRRKAKKSGRNIDTSTLPRERREYDLSPEDKTCDCGLALRYIGEETSEKVTFIPATLKVIEQACKKYCCRSCHLIKTAKKPEQALPKCLADASLITDVAIKKYQHHLPFYRQSKILKQQDIDIPDNTLGNWVMNGADLLQPIMDQPGSSVPK